MCLNQFYCDIEVLVKNTAKRLNEFSISLCHNVMIYGVIFAGGSITLCIQGMNLGTKS